MSDIKTINAVPVADIKTYQNIPLADVKTINALTLETAVPPTGPIPTAGLGMWYQADEKAYSKVAAQFVAANAEHLAVVSNASLQLGAIDWAIGGWVYLADLSNYRIIMSKRDTTVPMDYVLFFDLTGTRMSLQTGNGGIVSTGAVAAATWLFVIGSYDAATQVLSLQVNDGAYASIGVAATPPTISAASLRVGAQSTPGIGEYHNGYLQNLFIFGRGLNAAERTFLYNSGNGRRYEELSAAFKADLRAWWPLNELSGSRADLSGNNNTLTDNNTVGAYPSPFLTNAPNNGSINIWGDSGANGLDLRHYLGAPALAAGALNGKPVIRFEGTSAALVRDAVPGTVLCGPSATTVFVVQKQLTGDGGSNTYSWGGPGANNLYGAHLYYQPDGQLYFDSGNAIAADRCILTPPAGWNDTWQLIEMVRNGASCEVVLETGPLGVDTITGLFDNTQTANFHVGVGYQGADFFMGDMAELIFYNRTLNAAERTQVREYLQEKWFTPVLPDIAGLQAWYKADEGVYSRSAAQFVPANSEYLSAPHSASLSLGNIPWTIGGWVYWNGGGTPQIQFLKPNEYQIYSQTPGNIMSTLTGGVEAYTAIPIGSWFFYIGSYDGAGIVSTQINNGTPVTAACGPPSTSTDPVTMGAYSGPAYFHNGSMQNWFLFGRALNATERSFLYNSGNGRSYEELDAAFKTDLRAWWPLDETSGSRRDLSGNGNTLTDNNTVGEADGKVLNPASNGVKIYQWSDLSGSNRHLTRATLVERPVYLTGVQNGLSVAQFDGIAQSITGSWAGHNVGTVFTAMRYQGTLPLSFQAWLMSNTPSYGIIFRGTGPGWDTSFASLLTFFRDGVASAAVDNAWHNYVATGSPLGNSLLLVGNDPAAGGRFWYGQGGEIIIYDTQLSAGDRALVENYLRAKWGLP